MDVGQNITEFVVVQVGCPGKTIIDFITSTPVGMTKSAIQNPSTGKSLRRALVSIASISRFQASSALFSVGFHQPLKMVFKVSVLVRLITPMYNQINGALPFSSVSNLQISFVQLRYKDQPHHSAQSCKITPSSPFKVTIIIFLYL